MLNSKAHTLQHLWAEATERYATRTLIVSDKDGSRLSYGDAQQIVAMVSARLVDSGLSKGDAVCVYAPFHAEAAFVMWAATRLGIVFVPVDDQASPGYLGKVVKRISPKLVFCDRERFESTTGMISTERVVFDNLNDPAPQDTPCFSDWLRKGTNRVFSMPDVLPEDPAVILYTSGTTSVPKGVVLSHGALFRSAKAMGETFAWCGDDIFLCLGELHSMGGVKNLCLAPLSIGCAFVETTRTAKNNLLAIVECLRRNKCTLFNVAPALVRQMVEHANRISDMLPSTLRLLMCTGSDLAAGLVDEFQNRFRIPLLNYYGLTETSGLCIAVGANADEIHSGSIGRPVDCEIKIVDTSDRSVAKGEQGELCIASDKLMTGYYLEAELTSSVIKSRWFHTGDLARIRTDGQVELTGRIKDIIKNAHGDLVHPAELEAVLILHPDVQDVGVCGFLSSYGDERLAAFVVPVESTIDQETLFRELEAAIHTQLGPTKVPRVFRIVREIPRNTNGKILRSALKEALINE